MHVYVVVSLTTIEFLIPLNPFEKNCNQEKQHAHATVSSGSRFNGSGSVKMVVETEKNIKMKTTNLINLEYFMKTWNDKVSILKINLPTMEGIDFVFTNTWAREQNMRFHGDINHVTKTWGTT